MRGKPATCVTDRTRASWPARPTQSLTRTDTLIFHTLNRNYSLWFPHSRPAQSCQDLISNTLLEDLSITSNVRCQNRVKMVLKAFKIQLNVSLTIQIKLRWALFVTYTIIQSIMRSEMCSLHLTHPSGAVGSRHCSTRGAVGGQGSHLSHGHFLPEPGFEPTTLGYLGFQVQRAIH